MSTTQQAIFWFTAAAILILVLALLGDILLPFVLGAAVAYFLDPLADRLEKLGMSRFLATVLIVVSFILLVMTGLLFLLPPLAEQLAGLAVRMPGYLQSLRDILLSLSERWLGDALEQPNSGVEQAAADFIGKASGWVGQLLGSVWSGGMALVNTVALLLVTPVVTFYLLLDWDRMLTHIDNLLPRDHADTIRGLAREVDGVLSGFVRGQVTVLMLLGLMYVIGLTLIGLNFGLLIGVTAGLISFIPYVGPLIGFLVGGTVAVVQFGSDWLPIVGVLGVFLFGQIIEGNVLSPMIVGDRVGLHPVWLMFSLFVFAYLFGFVGMLVAVPVAAAIGVLVRFALQQYLASPLYHGTAGAAQSSADGSATVAGAKGKGKGK